MAADPPLRLVLIRHGQTEWSLDGRHTGRTDLPLTARGEDDARALAPLLHGMTIARVFTSPAVRARATCDLAGCGAAAEIEPDLAEWDYGAFEGRRSADILADRPGWNIYRDGCPGGESAAQIAARADRLIARLALLSGTIALFSHGQFSGALTSRWIAQPVAFGRHLLLATAGFGILGSNPDHPALRVIAHWNIVPTPE
jgi:probable phosphoglycerate mutase